MRYRDWCKLRRLGSYAARVALKYTFRKTAGEPLPICCERDPFRNAVVGGFRPIAATHEIIHHRLMTPITRGGAYGVIGSLALLGWFVVPLMVNLADPTCPSQLGCPTAIDAGAIQFLGVITFYCVTSGFLIRRLLNKQPFFSAGKTAATFIISLLLFAAPLWLVVQAALW